MQEFDKTLNPNSCIRLRRQDFLPVSDQLTPHESENFQSRGASIFCGTTRVEHTTFRAITHAARDMLRSCILLVNALLLIGSVHAKAPDKSCCAQILW